MLSYTHNVTVYVCTVTEGNLNVVNIQYIKPAHKTLHYNKPAIK